MKVKRLKVGVRQLKEGLQEFSETLKALQRGKKVRKRTGVYFVSVEAMRQALTEPRLRLLHLIKNKRPESIVELAKLAERDFKNVHADLQMLADLGLVELKGGARVRDSIKPKVAYERIQFEIAV